MTELVRELVLPSPHYGGVEGVGVALARTSSPCYISKTVGQLSTNLVCGATASEVFRTRRISLLGADGFDTNFLFYEFWNIT